MSIPISTIRSNVRRALGVDQYETGFDDPGIDELANRTYWEIQDKLHIRATEASTTLTTVAGDRELTLPGDFESLRLSAYIDPDSEKHTPLFVMSKNEYEAKYNASEDSQGVPTHYFRENNIVILYPTPDDEYEIELWYRSRLTDLSDSNTTPEVPRSWMECIEFGAMYRGAILLGDSEKVTFHKQNYYSALQLLVPVEAIEQDDWKMAGLQPIRSTYP